MRVMSYVPLGVDGLIVQVEADIRRGIPGVDITGLPDGAVRESRERVRAAFRNSGFQFPRDRVLVNLAPSGFRKEGAALDLPIAIAVMAACGLVPDPSGLMIMGELELSGRVRGVRGVLAASAAAIRCGAAGLLVPAENAAEAAVLSLDRAFAVGSLEEAVLALRDRLESGSFPPLSVPPCQSSTALEATCGDFSEVRGQGRYRRALEIAAAGGHNVLVFGPPGAGKTMLARRMPSILPDLSDDEAVEVTRLHSLAGVLPPGVSLLRKSPFRSPHHSASAEGLLGGGRQVRPGEISLAHFGTLFLDEAPEFRTNVLSSLREPLEDGLVTISRAEGSLRLPADFQLLLAANPCPCGKLGVQGASTSCMCSADDIARHWRRLGAALLDRVDIRVPLRAPDASAICGPPSESSGSIKARVQGAIQIQRERYKKGPFRRNARLRGAELDSYCGLDLECRGILLQAASKLGLSGRASHAVLRVARSIADLEASTHIQKPHLLEAIQHRRFGDDPWDVLLAESQDKGIPQ